MEALKIFRNIAYGVVAGPVMAVNYGAQLAITGVRNVREWVEEEDGDCYYVYYSLDQAFEKVADLLIPEIVGVDLIAGAFNVKMQHCQAWFFTSSSNYITFEICRGRTEGVILEKECDTIPGGVL